MIYLENKVDVQEVYIPRQGTIDVAQTGIDLSQYLTSGQTLQMIDEVIESAVTGYATEEWVEEQGYLTAYTETDPTVPAWAKEPNKPTYNASEVGALPTGTTLDGVPDGITRKLITSGQVQTQINNSISGIPTEFKTINGESVVGSGNIEIDGAIYTAGQNINISNENEISVTGITIPDVSNFVTSGQVKTQIESYDYATEDWVEGKGYLTEHQSLSAYSTTQQVEGMIDDAIATETARTESTYLKEHQSLSAYSTTQEVENMISSAKTEIENEIPDVSNFVTSGDVQTQINESTSGIPTEFKTINNESIIGSGNIEIQGGGSYSAGENIDITNDVISVTGITIPDTSEYAKNVRMTGVTNSLVDGYWYQIPQLEYDQDGETGQKRNTVYFKRINGQKIIKTSGDTEGEVIIDIPTSNTAFTNDAGYITSAYTGFTTSGDVQTQIDGAIAIETARTESTYLKEHQSLSAYSTTQQVEGMITAATSGLQETLVSGTNIKTINNQSILGSGNIDIQGGGGSENVVELTKAEYAALTAYTEDTTYIITDADTVDLNDFALESAVTSAITEINTELETKATKANISNHNTRQFPTWNAEGIVTGTTGNTLYEVSHSINGSSRTVLSNSSSNLTGIYAPTSAGTKDQVLLSNGSGAPIWSTYKFVFISQSDYDALATKDSTTIYFIVQD